MAKGAEQSVVFDYSDGKLMVKAGGALREPQDDALALAVTLHAIASEGWSSGRILIDRVHESPKGTLIDLTPPGGEKASLLLTRDGDLNEVRVERPKGPEVIGYNDFLADAPTQIDRFFHDDPKLFGASVLPHRMTTFGASFALATAEIVPESSQTAWARAPAMSRIHSRRALSGSS